MSNIKRQFTTREFHSLLIDNGYEVDRYSGDHRIYSNGSNTVSVPAGKKHINRMLARRLIKENNLTV